ncbi:hypothetical protein RhiirA5_439319 [Rhizophagus irregularis]|uniref:Uncharacterized protein n=1 Tax=Rhizophagus irregularis TaxID=588596 RepID=A0A2N0NI11_9GLOM|nr:hypothetical protein RhiirA5_439319 [Rhizophagus irregularis]
MPKKQKTSSVFTRYNEYKDIFRVDDNVLFCNYCNISIDWKRKSTVDNHCKSQKHVIDVRSQKESQNKTQQLTLLCTQAVSESKKQLIEDQTFLLKKQNYLPSIFDKHFQSLKLFFDSKPVAIIMGKTTDDCARSVVNTLFCYRNETK